MELSSATPPKCHAPLEGCGTLKSHRLVIYEKFLIDWHWFRLNRSINGWDITNFPDFLNIAIFQQLFKNFWALAGVFRCLPIAKNLLQDVLGVCLYVREPLKQKNSADRTNRIPPPINALKTLCALQLNLPACSVDWERCERRDSGCCCLRRQQRERWTNFSAYCIS